VIKEMSLKARTAAKSLARFGYQDRQRIVNAIADRLDAEQAAIVAKNEEDLNE
jgi:gamma-glutamyl phosphate reductase